MSTYQFDRTGAAIDALLDKTEWQFATYNAGSQSGAVTLTPANGYKQRSAVTASITGLTCALSATYPALLWEITTDGDYGITLTGWETPYGDDIILPDTGTCQIVLSLSADGTTKYAAMVMTEVA